MSSCRVRIVNGELLPTPFSKTAFHKEFPMQFGLMAIALLAGLALTVQVGLNGIVRSTLGGAGMAALANNIVGTTALIAFVLATRATIPPRETWISQPAWVWTGGLLGAFFVAAGALVGPKIGAASWLAITVFGQLVASLIVGQFGWLGFPVQPISVARVVGAALLLGGVLLIAR